MKEFSVKSFKHVKMTKKLVNLIGNIPHPINIQQQRVFIFELRTGKIYKKCKLITIPFIFDFEVRGPTVFKLHPKCFLSSSLLLNPFLNA